jgi:acyl-CoA synthetase (AMP-forming)/AMP-acid ligase II
MTIRDEVRERLSGPGGFFEMVEEDVLGERMRVFKNRPLSLRDVLEASVAHGDKEYIVDGPRRLTYAALQPTVASVALALREDYDIQPGDRVAILAANSAEWAIAFWATVSLGGVVAALNGWWTRDEIEYGVSDSAPKLLIGDRKRLERVAGVDLGVRVLEIESEFGALELHTPNAALPNTPIAEDDRAVILYTSGTTGRPKGAVGTHRAIIGFFQGANANGLANAMIEFEERGEEFPLAAPRPQMVVLATSPMFHLSGLYAQIVLQLAGGGKLVTHPGRFDPESVLQLMEREGISQFTAMGAMGPRIAHHPRLLEFDLSAVTSVGFGGAPASPAVQDLMRQAFPNASSNVGIGYGSSETIAVPATFGGTDYIAHPEATGRVCLGHEIEIRDPEGKVLPNGQQGEIFVRSAWTMLEYWGKPEATSETIGPGRWLATGDIGRIEPGELLYINSRARDMILRNAENIYPVELEYRLDKHSDVRESAVYGIEHAEWGQEVKAVVVPETGATLDTNALASWVGETLAAFKVPTAWEIRTEPLPRNPSGKVLKNVLMGQAANAFVEE